MKNLLEIDGVILEYGLKRILQNVYLKSESGKVTGILGRNGSGKSCLMKVIFGDIIPTNKSIRINGQSILNANNSYEEIRYLPQKNFIPKMFSINRIFKDFNLEFKELINDFPQFEKRSNNKLKDFSSGERRIIEIYTILVSRGKFCMLDEPFSQVMPIHVETLKKIIKREKANKGIIITDHLYKHIVEISDDIYLISDGTTHLTKDIEDLQRLGYARM